ncbi:methyltransferase domain-containing protein [Nocardioides sp. cx-169]|uniref:class I SAM-dependent methyltransferase n=1 Tax=Nocardioides sp. cx-169 TaxID=2899080 RepID=UPI001E3B5ED4|nr:methyltransferase domain-containing protein [Nocardioides sp. cx-169]MCD4535635.1 methyltransferase domain-containing protein [Nocardioides sp. cx-169]
MTATLGASHAVLHTSAARKTYHRIFGIDDLHSHFRWNAAKRYIDFTAERTLEVGANSGVMTFALASRMGGQIVSSEFDTELLGLAHQIQETLAYPNITLGQADLRTLGEEGAAFDQALVIDVMEHIDDHETAARQLAAALRPGASLVISVPTPNYPKVFGREFHEAIGHVRDGYWIEDMEALLAPAGFQIERHHYYTGRLASAGCSLVYRRPLSRKAALLATPALRGAGMLTERNVKREHAASLALVARRI